MPNEGVSTQSDGASVPAPTIQTRGYQQEMLDESLRRNIIIALDTGAGKTHIAVLRMKHETEHGSRKVSWFLAPTVALARQQKEVIKTGIPASVGLISGVDEPDQWKDRQLWIRVLKTHRIVVSTPDVLLNALRHGYVLLGRDVGLLVMDEAHHAADKHAYNLVMREFYDKLPPRSDSPSEIDETMRPMVLGLTASPIFGGDAERAFRQLEYNLDSTICAPLLCRRELEGFVHRPEFKLVTYTEPEYLLIEPIIPPSSNLRSLKGVVDSLNIEEDPWVVDQRIELRRLEPGPRRNRIDQTLSKTIDKQSTFTHRGLRDFERAADEICADLGEWAADWYIEQVCKQAASAGGTFPEFSFNWSESERKYLLRHLARVKVAHVPDDDPEDMVRRSSEKVEKLIDVLLSEKASFEAKLFEGEPMEYRGLIFVTRRDTVLALTEILARHPRTAKFSVGSLLGEAGNSRRHAFLDITRRLLRQPAPKTLADFRIGELNLIVATAVAEEGIDVQACCNVVRWDFPANMVSWAQSRGRARQAHSSFVLMLSNSLAFASTVRRWEELEKEMATLYNTRVEFQELNIDIENQPTDDDEYETPFTVAETGAMLTENAAIEHIFHFCSILPYSGLLNHVPLFDIDPPDYPLEWHTNHAPRTLSQGPYGCTLTLPRLLDYKFRTFSTPRIHNTKVAARRHVAFQAYRALYENGLLNDHLLPITGALEPELGSEVRILLKDVERREGTVLVSGQMDPWCASNDGGVDKQWWSTILEIEGLPPIRMLTQTVVPSLENDELPIIYSRERPPFKVGVQKQGTPITPGEDDGILARAKEFTRRFFWPMYGSRLKTWDQTDFLHLFLPVDESPTIWDERRAAFSDHNPSATGRQTLLASFSWFERRYGHVDDIFLVSGTSFTSKCYQFIARTRNTPPTPEEMADLLRRHVRRGDNDGAANLEITYPLIEARSLVKRNFLRPMPDESKGMDAVSQKPVLLLKDFTLVSLTSSHEAQYANWAPSIIRHLQMACTASSLRDALFGETPLANIPLDLLLTAITTPSAQERSNYQRLEILGDTTLKYAVSIQVLSAHPLWHEGYLARRKDHAVSNANLAKEAIHRKLYKWIIRDLFVPRKWKPRRASDPVVVISEETPVQSATPGMTEKQKRRATVARNLSTKVLADVVEALIGAAYLHGAFQMGVECMKVFGLGLSWSPLPTCIDAMYSRITDFKRYPTQIGVVEDILGYRFRRKAIAVEALTHASYQNDLESISYERMEFLGDAVLDMLVTDYLYHAPGKYYGPGRIHNIKTAVVNAHFLAMLCLRAFTESPVVMPSWSSEKGMIVTEDAQHIHLYKCLLHSSVHVLDEQQATFARWERPGGRDKIEAALEGGHTFPWSALTALQAPKFLSDMVESLLGAVFLDSCGDLEVVRGVLRRLGHWGVLERIVESNTDVMHPLSRLNIWAGKNHERVKCGTPKRNENRVSCSVFWDDYEVAKVEAEWSGRISREDVRFAVAEKAIALLEDPVSLLRIWLAKQNRSVEYSIEEAQGMRTCAVIVQGTEVAHVVSRDLSTWDEAKRAAAMEALKTLEVPVHWLDFLSIQHGFDVRYEIYEEDGTKVCCVHVDGFETGKVEYPIKGPGPVVTERDMMDAAAKKAIVVLEQQVGYDELWKDADWGNEDWE